MVVLQEGDYPFNEVGRTQGPYPRPAWRRGAAFVNGISVEISLSPLGQLATLVHAASKGKRQVPFERSQIMPPT